MINYADVVVHPARRHLDRNRVQDIVRTLRQHGMTNDTLGAVVAYRPSVGWVLLGGEHRLAAASAPGAKGLFIVVRSWTEFCAWMAVDASDSRRTPMDPLVQVAFLERATAALKPGRGERTTLDVAEYANSHRQIIDNVRYVVGLTRDPDEPEALRDFAQLKLDEVERGDFTGHGVRDAVNRFRTRLSEGDRPMQSAAAQRKAFESVGQLEGIIAALADLGPINPDLPKEERDKLADRLARLGAPLTKIKKMLRGESA